MHRPDERVIFANLCFLVRKCTFRCNDRLGKTDIHHFCIRCKFLHETEYVRKVSEAAIFHLPKSRKMPIVQQRDVGSRDLSLEGPEACLCVCQRDIPSSRVQQLLHPSGFPGEQNEKHLRCLKRDFVKSIRPDGCIKLTDASLNIPI
jgi:hypothetical protein